MSRSQFTLYGKNLESFEEADVVGKCGRFLRLPLGDDVYQVIISREARPATHTHPPEPAATPDFEECAQVLARLVVSILTWKPEKGGSDA